MMDDINVSPKQKATNDLSSSIAIYNLLSNYFLGDAGYVLEVDRDDDDSYTFRFDRVKTISSGLLARNDAMSIIPTGSYWSYFLGWRDIFGIPIPSDNSKWLALGIETALKHKTRGSYLYLKALFLPLPLNDSVLQKLEDFVNGLSYSIERKQINRLKALELKARGSELNIRGSTVLDTNSKSISEYGFIESWIIRQACWQYQKGEILTFRTSAMKESQLSLRGKPHIIGRIKCVSQSSAFQD
ncbi:MAG: hypothetical protein KME30_08740 [Iphinoe sp. HA4291-MV1]|jgi:hypothetical protein|nr:hypothetical protein [Iphinoe sp. HA4291-MV1]